ncbi:MAG: DCC1-like thiol-disulfide oxidoreductase family protein [Pseudomonadota bacterium]
MDDAPIIVFDTDCVLCSGLVAFILERERDDQLRFVGAWSDDGKRLAESHGFTQAYLDETFLVIQDGRAFTRSDAALRIARHLCAPWSWLRVLRIVPRSLRNWVYGAVAKRRYAWFGRRENCVVVPAASRHRFMGIERSNPISTEAAGTSRSAK